MEPFREPFPYVKVDLNQNYPHNFSGICIDFHRVEQKQSDHTGNALS